MRCLQLVRPGQVWAWVIVAGLFTYLPVPAADARRAPAVDIAPEPLDDAVVILEAVPAGQPGKLEGSLRRILLNRPEVANPILVWDGKTKLADGLKKLIAELKRVRGPSRGESVLTIEADGELKNRALLPVYDVCKRSGFHVGLRLAKAAAPVHEPLQRADVDPAAIEPDIDINYNVDRKADVSVPGLVNPNEPVGVRGIDVGRPPTNLPVPDGLALPREPGGLDDPTVPKVNAARGGAAKEKVLREGGGTKESEAAVASGLNWLAKVQSQDGAWQLDGRFKNPGSQNDVAGTAFGLLPFLAAGRTHKAAKDNAYDKEVERGLRFLMRKQDSKTGNFGGGMYSHCLATIATCEAYGSTNDPVLRKPAQLAVNYLVVAQHEAGGWRYGPNQVGDTSVTGWAVQALKAAQFAGLHVPELTFRKAIRYLDSCAGEDQGYGYTGPGSTPSMSAVGLLCRQYLQSWGPQNVRMIRGVKNNIEPLPPPAQGQPMNMYYYYYATQVMHNLGGDSWTKWNDKMRDSLVRSQDKSADPLLKGSWDPSGDPHGGVGGRLMYTSLALLTLEVYYRHVPLFAPRPGKE